MFCDEGLPNPEGVLWEPAPIRLLKGLYLCREELVSEVAQFAFVIEGPCEALNGECVVFHGEGCDSQSTL